jgi:hypothetical protein
LPDWDDLVGETTDLESRIAFNNRRNQKNDAMAVEIDFMAEPADPQAVTLFELLPLLRALRRIVTSCRPLGASDYELPSESTSNPAVEPNPQGIVLAELKIRLQSTLIFSAGSLGPIPPLGADNRPTPKRANASCAALRTLADFGLPDGTAQRLAFPKSCLTIGRCTSAPSLSKPGTQALKACR